MWDKTPFRSEIPSVIPKTLTFDHYKIKVDIRADKKIIVPFKTMTASFNV